MQKQEQHSLLSRPQENSHHPCCVCSSWTLILMTCLWSWKLWVISEDNIRLKAAQWRCAMFWLFLEIITIPYPEWGSNAQLLSALDTSELDIKADAQRQRKGAFIQWKVSEAPREQYQFPEYKDSLEEERDGRNLEKEKSMWEKDWTLTWLNTLWEKLTV